MTSRIARATGRRFRIGGQNRLVVWLALFALLFRIGVPLVHHPRTDPGSASASGSAMDGMAHCPMGMAGPGQPHAPSGDHSPLHHVPPCPICQALQQTGSFLPPVVAVVVPVLLVVLRHRIWPNAPGIRLHLALAAHPRAPPQTL